MQRLTRCVVFLGVLAFAWACSGDPTDNQGTPTLIVATPEVMTVAQGDSQAVITSLVDEDGQGLQAEFSVSAVGSGITVSGPDPDFLPVLGGNSIGRQARFFVTGVDLVKTTFTVNASGLTKVVTVTVTPADLMVSLSNSAPVLGEPVVITAPPGSFFSQTSVVTAGLQTQTVTDRAADGSTITIIPSPNIDGQLQITEIGLTGNDALILTRNTAATLTTPVFDSLSVAFSTATPTLGQTVTATLMDDPLVTFDATAKLNFPGELPGPAAGPQNITVAPGGASLTFQAPPNADGPATVTGFAFPGGYKLTFPTKTGITSPNIGTTINATFNPASPGLLDVVTVTPPAGLKFAQTVKVSFGAAAALIQSVAADGSTMDILPLPGSQGAATIAGVVPTAATQFSVTLPTVATVNIPVLIPLSGTGNPATAPALTIPTLGNSTVLNDAGAFDGPGDCCFGGPTRFYKLTIAAPTTLTFTVDWFEGQDLGVYITESDGVTVIDAGDSFGEGPGGHPESVTVVFAPGNYFAAIPNFSNDNPSFFQLKLSNP